MFKPTILAISAAFALSGCAGGAAVVQADISTVISDVQAATQAICLVVPTANSIAQIVAVGDPLLATASAIASVICKAVSAAPVSTRLGSVRGTVRPAPVVIDGITVTFR